jgi:hypothetical protein
MINDNTPGLYEVVFHYGFQRKVTITITANSRQEALQKIDYMVETKDKLIPDGFDSWIME